MMPVFPPSVLMAVYTDAPNDPRVINEARSLVSMGYRVTLFGAAVYDNAPGAANVDGVDICILPAVKSGHPVAMLKMIWKWLRGRPFSDDGSQARSSGSNILAIIWFNLWIIRLSLRQRVNVIHCHEHQAMMAAWLLAKWHRVPWIYDAHEHTAENRAGKGFKASSAVRIEKMLLSKPDVVITVGQRLAHSLRERGARRVIVIGNWKPLDKYQVAPEISAKIRSQLGLTPEQLVLVYIGVLQPDREIDALLQAMTLMPEAALIIGGFGMLQDVVEEAARNYANIHWIGRVKPDAIPAYTAAADVVYYCLNPDNLNNYYSTPNKLFEALAAGKPMIARRGLGEISLILEEVGSAILLDAVTPEILVEAFSRLCDPVFYKQLEERTAIGREQYNWARAEENLRVIYAELIGRD